MTLSSFKKHSKLTVAVLALVLYGLGFYLLGSTSLSQKAADLLKVKGAATQKGPDSPIQSPIPATDVQSGTIIASSVKLCSNATYNFSVNYPQDWFTTYNSDDQKCKFFAPFAFTVPYDTDAQFTPIYIEVIKPEDWSGTVKYYENPNDFQNIVSIQNLQINGKDVQEVKALGTGKGATTKGFVKTSFLIPDIINPLVVIYNQQDPKENTDLSGKVLEDMARSIQFF